MQIGTSMKPEGVGVRVFRSSRKSDGHELPRVGLPSVQSRRVTHTQVFSSPSTLRRIAYSMCVFGQVTSDEHVDFYVANPDGKC